MLGGVQPSQAVQKLCRFLIGNWGWQTIPVDETWTPAQCYHYGATQTPSGYPYFGSNPMCVLPNGVISTGSNTVPPSPNCGW